jgi:DNA polymerase-3 subunit epsilon
MSGHTQGLSGQSQHLTNILAHYNIPDLGAHDAYNDAIMTAMAFLHMR